MKKLTIGHLYPDLLNLYGDRGNIQCFRKRLEWRGMEAEVIPFLSGEKIDFSKLDIVLLGGGSDREQELVCGFLKDIKDDFKTEQTEYGTEENLILQIAQIMDISQADVEQLLKKDTETCRKYLMKLEMDGMLQEVSDGKFRKVG